MTEEAIEQEIAAAVKAAVEAERERLTKPDPKKKTPPAKKDTEASTDAGEADEQEATPAPADTEETAPKKPKKPKKKDATTAPAEEPLSPEALEAALQRVEAEATAAARDQANDKAAVIRIKRIRAKKLLKQFK
ncbi:hypothetical protein H696_01402 [Fonticula alba]|uniref:Uncharacterized protein n=1 Tax=Fonticula alba TaxID=691883 RepID=A0A058ZC62_FONAL|nr:hypothetical protein H696_01402 [Fonticula alba]KCV71995.1 hypothetical protein H696_01402 [Fonticula alba]|eukprot:XP_009493573.1 hypothetical protein H696_01402 [Fonticula alba]